MQASANYDITFRIYKSNNYQMHKIRLNVLAIISFSYEHLYVMSGNSKYLRVVFSVIIQNDELIVLKFICEMISVQRETFIS